MKASSVRPAACSRCSRPLSSARSVPGRIWRNRSALGGGGGAARVHHDQLGAGRRDALHHPQEEDGVAVGHVGADDEEQVGVVEVPVGAGRPVRPQRQLVAGAGAGHAQPGVGLDLVGPQVSLGQFVRQVLGFQAHLPGDVQGDRVGAVLVHDAAQAAGGLGDGGVQGRGLGLLAAGGPDQGGGQAAGRGQQVGGGRALGAQPASVRRVLLVAARAQHGAPPVGAPPDVEDQAAAHPAVGADRPHLRRAVVHRARRGHGRLPCCAGVSGDGRNRGLRGCLRARSPGVKHAAQVAAGGCEPRRRPGGPGGPALSAPPACDYCRHALVNGKSGVEPVRPSPL
jgi:hypothetical protein